MFKEILPPSLGENPYNPDDEIWHRLSDEEIRRLNETRRDVTQPNASTQMEPKPTE